MASKTQALEEVASLWANYWLSERQDSVDFQESAA